MSPITKEFTKEQLIERLQHRISVASGFPESEKAQMDLELARIALASIEAEAYGYVHKAAYEQAGSCGLSSDHEAYRDSPTHIAVYTVPPAPVSVPAAMEMDDDFDSAFEHGKAAGWNAYRAAMLQGAEPVTTANKLPDDFICMLTGRAKYLREKGEIKSPELLERAAAALQGESVNTSSIPNGWKLVPIDPTKDMLRAGQSVVGFWLNTVHCYSKMLAAAPAAPQQEADNE
ncbi:hypothetical protein AAHD34_18610 [Enterobacter hormaechei]|uniref:hypothetical protein n=1 Tax=Enterobacter hormaechei TaxID=158836 RepID=UPI003967D26F